MLNNFSTRTRRFMSILTTSVILAGAFSTTTFAMDKEGFPNELRLRVLNYASLLANSGGELLIKKNFRQVCKIWQKYIDAETRQNIRNLMENKTVLFRMASPAVFSSVSWEIKDNRFPSDQGKQGAIANIKDKIEANSTLFLERVGYSSNAEATNMTFTCKLCNPIGPKDPENILAVIAVKVTPEEGL